MTLTDKHGENKVVWYVKNLHELCEARILINMGKWSYTVHVNY